MHKSTTLLFLLFLAILGISAEPETKSQGVTNDTFHSLKLLKTIFNARIIGVELYSPLALPEINSEDTMASAVAKLRSAGFGVLERDHVVNLTDEKERPTGKKPYPFSQRIKIASGKYGTEELCAIIKKQTEFKVDTTNLQRQTWMIDFIFSENTVLSVREILNLMAEKMHGVWLVERGSFMMNMSLKAGEYIKTDHPKLKEDDEGFLYLQ